MIKVDLSGAAGFFDPAGPDYAAAAQAHRTLLEHTGAGAETIFQLIKTVFSSLSLKHMLLP